MNNVSESLRLNRKTWAANRKQSLSPPASPRAVQLTSSEDAFALNAARPALKTRLKSWTARTREVVNPSFQQAKTAREVLLTAPHLLARGRDADHETRLVVLEEGTRDTMGIVGMRGWEWGVRVGFGIGSLASFVLAMVPGALLPLPVLATLILVSATVVGALVGGAWAAYARHRFAVKNPELKACIMNELLVLQDEIHAMPQDKFTGLQLRQLRRIELLQKDIEGGFRHAAWQLVYGITHVDPKLRTMFKTYLPKEPPVPETNWFFWRGNPEATAVNVAARPDYLPHSPPPQTR